MSKSTKTPPQAHPATNGPNFALTSPKATLIHPFEQRISRCQLLESAAVAPSLRKQPVQDPVPGGGGHVGDVKVDPPVVVEVAEGDAHAVARIQKPQAGGPILEPVPQIDVVAVFAEIVGHVEVQSSVSVDVGELGGVAPALVADTPRGPRFAEAPIALIQKEQVRSPVGCAVPGVGHDPPVAVVGGDVDVGPAVPVDVTGGDAETDGIHRHADLLRDVEEKQLPGGHQTVLEQHLLSHRGHEDVQVPIVVEVEEQRSRSRRRHRDSRLVCHILKPAALVQVEIVPVDSRDHQVLQPVPVQISRGGAVIDEIVVSRFAVSGQRNGDSRRNADLGEEVRSRPHGPDTVYPEFGDLPVLLPSLDRDQPPRSLHPESMVLAVPSDQEEFEIPLALDSPLPLAEAGPLDLESGILHGGEGSQKFVPALHQFSPGQLLRTLPCNSGRGRRDPLELRIRGAGERGPRRHPGRGLEELADPSHVPLPDRHREFQKGVGQGFGALLDLVQLNFVQLGFPCGMGRNEKTHQKNSGDPSPAPECRVDVLQGFLP